MHPSLLCCVVPPGLETATLPLTCGNAIDWVCPCGPSVDALTDVVRVMGDTLATLVARIMACLASGGALLADLPSAVTGDRVCER